jgi:hypothetical protein
MTFFQHPGVSAALVCFAALVTTASAQERPAVQPDLKACAEEQRLQPGEQAPRLPNQSAETLSDKLARTDGVLCPPAVDAEIKAPTPDAGRTPVIPPGSPGGDPTVRPR